MIIFDTKTSNLAEELATGWVSFSTDAREGGVGVDALILHAVRDIDLLDPLAQRVGAEEAVTRTRIHQQTKSWFSLNRHEDGLLGLLIRLYTLGEMQVHGILILQLLSQGSRLVSRGCRLYLGYRRTRGRRSRW